MTHWTYQSIQKCPFCGNPYSTDHIQNHIITGCTVFKKMETIKEYQIKGDLYMMVVANPTTSQVYALFLDELHDPIEVIDCTLEHGKGKPLGVIDKMIANHNNALYALQAIREAISFGYVTHDMEVQDDND